MWRLEGLALHLFPVVVLAFLGFLACTVPGHELPMASTILQLSFGFFHTVWMPMYLAPYAVLVSTGFPLFAVVTPVRFDAMLFPILELGYDCLLAVFMKHSQQTVLLPVLIVSH